MLRVGLHFLGFNLKSWLLQAGRPWEAWHLIEVAHAKGYLIFPEAVISVLRAFRGTTRLSMPHMQVRALFGYSPARSCILPGSLSRAGSWNL